MVRSTKTSFPSRIMKFEVILCLLYRIYFDPLTVEISSLSENSLTGGMYDPDCRVRAKQEHSCISETNRKLTRSFASQVVYFSTNDRSSRQITSLVEDEEKNLRRRSTRMRDLNETKSLPLRSPEGKRKRRLKRNERLHPQYCNRDAANERNSLSLNSARTSTYTN